MSQELVDHLKNMFETAAREGLYIGMGYDHKLPMTRQSQEGPMVRELRRLVENYRPPGSARCDYPHCNCAVSFPEDYVPSEATECPRCA